jgi:hypothetical protein
LILPNNQKLIWLDVLSYFLALQENISDIIKHTQWFFLGLIKEISTPNNKICFGKVNRNSFISFIKEASSKNRNTLANGFTKYYSDFAALARLIFEGNKSGQFYQESLEAIDVLDRVALEFSDDSVKALQQIYENTQICSILDTGLVTLFRFVNNLDPKFNLPESTSLCIKEFLRNCMLEAYKWHDITLIDNIIEFESASKSKGFDFKFKFYEIYQAEWRESCEYMFQYFLDTIYNKKLMIGDIIMLKKTIFLSYAEIDSGIADCLDSELQGLGYDVKRYTREVKPWGDFKEFMKTIRKEDYVVFLVSDTFLKRDNCLLEVHEFLKDDTFKERAYPVGILFSTEEVQKRNDEGKATSMFSPEYLFEIVDFWQARAQDFDMKIANLTSENRYELDGMYRDIKNAAATASEFLKKIFETLLETINPGAPKFKEIANSIDKKIREMTASGMTI